MKNIYHKHTSSNSYTDSSWTDEDYYLCDTMEEYADSVEKCKAKVKEYHTSGRAALYGDWRITVSDEKTIHATEYYYGHEWQGMTFDAVGVTYTEHLERSHHYTHYLKPDSVKGMKKCSDRGIGWMYGS